MPLFDAPSKNANRTGSAGSAAFVRRSTSSASCINVSKASVAGVEALRRTKSPCAGILPKRPVSCSAMNPSLGSSAARARARAGGDGLRHREALEQVIELRGAQVDVQVGLAAAQLPDRRDDLPFLADLGLIQQVEQPPLAVVRDQLLTALAERADRGAGLLLA